MKVIEEESMRIELEEGLFWCIVACNYVEHAQGVDDPHTCRFAASSTSIIPNLDRSEFAWSTPHCRHTTHDLDVRSIRGSRDVHAQCHEIIRSDRLPSKHGLCASGKVPHLSKLERVRTHLSNYCLYHFLAAHADGSIIGKLNQLIALSLTLLVRWLEAFASIQAQANTLLNINQHI